MNLVFIYLGEECLVISYSASCVTMCLLDVIYRPVLHIPMRAAASKIVLKWNKNFYKKNMAVQSSYFLRESMEER